MNPTAVDDNNNYCDDLDEEAFFCYKCDKKLVVEGPNPNNDNFQCCQNCCAAFCKDCSSSYIIQCTSSLCPDRLDVCFCCGVYCQYAHALVHMECSSFCQDQLAWRRTQNSSGAAAAAAAAAAAIDNIGDEGEFIDHCLKCNKEYDLSTDSDYKVCGECERSCCYGCLFDTCSECDPDNVDSIHVCKECSTVCVDCGALLHRNCLEEHVTKTCNKLYVSVAERRVLSLEKETCQLDKELQKEEESVVWAQKKMESIRMLLTITRKAKNAATMDLRREKQKTKQEQKQQKVEKKRKAIFKESS